MLGRSVDVRTSGRALFFVVGRSGPPDAVVASLGGTVVTRLPDGQRVLAVLARDDVAALRLHSEIALAGPVPVDGERFSTFTRLIGLDDGPGRRRRP